MKMTETDFETIVGRAMQDPQVAHMGPVIRKELLHYDILFSLHQTGLLENLTFQGGTSLRLCYGSRRYSEDLDFAGGQGFSSTALQDMKGCLEDYLGTRYGLEVRVKEPPVLKKERGHTELKVDRWQVSITTCPEHRDLPGQRIKIEVTNVPAYTKKVLALKKNHAHLSDGYDDILLTVESLDEIMADKLVSLAAAGYVRHRDIWDLSWIQRQGTGIHPELVENKIEDYQIAGYYTLIENIMDRCPIIIEGDAFKNEMKRFLPADIHARTLGNNRYREALIGSITGLYAELKQCLQPDGTTLQSMGRPDG